MDGNITEKIKELEDIFNSLETKVDSIQSQLRKVQGQMEYFELMFDSIMDLGIIASGGRKKK
jgi:hypothetical protein